MSTKTNFKRIALVAVAALGLSVFSSVPASQALISGVTVTTAAGTGTTTNYDSSTAATITVSGLLDAATDSITVTYVAKSAPTGVTVGANTGILRYLDSTTAATATSTVVDTALANGAAPGHNSLKLDSVTTANVFKGFRITGSTSMIIGASFRMEMDSAGALSAGTYVYQVNVTQHTLNGTTVTRTTTAYDLTNVISATGTSSLTATSTNSFSRLGPDAVADGASDAADSAMSVLATTGSVRGYILVAVRNAANGASVAVDSLTATVTGAGLICTEGNVCGKSIKVAAAGDYLWSLQGDGVGGTSNISITSSVTGLTYAHTLSYYTASPKTWATPTVATPLLRIGSNDDAVRITATDANGSPWTGSAYIYASSAADALIGGSQTPVLCTYDATDGRHECPIAGTSVGTAKFKIIDAATVATATLTSSEVSVTVSNSVAASVKISFDKATYAPNEKARIYVTPLDSSGKPMQTSTNTNLLATGGISTNSSFGFGGTSTTNDSLTAVSITTKANSSSATGAVAGSMEYTVFMPAAGGTVTITAKGGSSLPAAGQVTVTASATVTDNGAAALAAVNSLATTVASLKTLITTLTNLVLKIQKKVKA